MALTAAQSAQLATDILTTHQAEFADEVTTGNDQAIADAYNAGQDPDFWVWRTSVPSQEYAGSGGILWTEVNSLPEGRARIFTWLSRTLTFPLNMAQSAVRDGVEEAFGTNSTTWGNLLVMARRPARRIERLYATGTGTTATPGLLTYEGIVTPFDIAHALGRG